MPRICMAVSSGTGSRLPITRVVICDGLPALHPHTPDSPKDKYFGEHLYPSIVVRAGGTDQRSPYGAEKTENYCRFFLGLRGRRTWSSQAKPINEWRDDKLPQPRHIG